MGAVGSTSALPSYDYDNATNFNNNISSTTKWFENDKLSNYGDWKNNLTDDEKYAISMFTGTSYNGAFAQLYGLDWDDMGDSAKVMSSNLYDAINKFELKKPINVFRKTDSKLFGKAGMSYEELKALEGQIFHSNGFMSTSASNQGVGIQSSALQMKITVPKSVGAGAFIANQSSMGPGEKEFLMNNNGFYKIESVTKVGGKPQINVKWIGQSKDQIFGGSNGNKGSIEQKTVSQSVKKKK